MNSNLEQVKITAVNDFGKVYGKIAEQDRRFFVSKAVIGDEVIAKIIKQNNKFIEGKIVEIVKKSEFRIEPNCKFFYSCGGCNFLNYQEQYYQQIKSQILSGILLKNKIFANQPAIEEKIDFFWLGQRSRRKAVFQIDKNNLIGFFAPQSHDLVNIDDCLLVEKEISDLIPILQKFLSGLEKNLFSSAIVTSFDNVIDVVLVINENHNYNLNKIFNQENIKRYIDFAQNHKINLSYRLKDKVIALFLLKKNQISLTKSKIDVDSEVFIQASKKALKIISQKIISSIKKGNLNGGKIKRIADLYSGFGFYSLTIIEECEDIIDLISAYEGNQKMVNLINQNATNNNLSNKIKAFKKDLVKQPLNIDELNKFDLAIINPPRAGAENQIKKIADSKLKNLIMISCNPISFAMDAKILIESGFAIESISAIDQFYSSANFEVIANFNKK
jgi:23S rRNA (uracil1939-C5)-methyltransferase